MYINSYWNQSFWSISRPSITFPGIATTGEQDCEERISSISFFDSRNRYSYVRSKCEIPIRFIPRSSSPFVITLFSRETCSILVDQSYYHAPYLGRSKDVLDFATQNLLKKSIRRFVEVLSSNAKTILSTEITISTTQIFFQRNFLKFQRSMHNTAREKALTRHRDSLEHIKIQWTPRWSITATLLSICN